MKKLLFTISLFTVLACSGQDVCTYSDRYVDSLKSIIETQDTEINQQSILINVQGWRISELTQDKDSLLSNNENLRDIVQALTYPKDTLLFYNDTISLSLLSNNVRLNVSKIGSRFNYQLIDGLHRLNIYYDDKQFREYMMYDTSSYNSWLHTFSIPVK